jgi:hypothetical protein
VLGPFDDASDFDEEGLAYVQEGDTCGFIDRTGTMIFRTQPFSVVLGGFHEGMCCVAVMEPLIGWRWGFIDKAGTVVIPTQIDLPPSAFSGGLAAAAIGSPETKWGYINKIGQWVISARYDWAEGFDHGLAEVGTGQSWMDPSAMIGYIDTHGHYIWPLQN